MDTRPVLLRWWKLRCNRRRILLHFTLGVNYTVPQLKWDKWVGGWEECQRGDGWKDGTDLLVVAHLPYISALPAFVEWQISFEWRGPARAANPAAALFSQHPRVLEAERSGCSQTQISERLCDVNKAGRRVLIGVIRPRAWSVSAFFLFWSCACKENRVSPHPPVSQLSPINPHFSVLSIDLSSSSLSPASASNQ